MTLDKMNLLPCAAALLLSMSVAHASTTPTVKQFEATGKITQKGCQIVPSQSISVTAISFDKLEDAATVENKGPAYPTMIVLDATNCSPGQVTATIQGTADKVDGKLLAIDDVPGAAQNVALAFAGETPDTGGTIFQELNTGSLGPAKIIDNNTTYEFFFSVEPVKTATTAVAGSVSATAQIHINYL